MALSENKRSEFDEVLQRSRSILYRICLAFTDRRPENVEDLYQEITRNLWAGWAGFRGECSVTTWVYRIAINTAGTELRRRKGEPDFVPINKQTCESLANEPEDPLLADLYDLIDQLPEEEKKITYLYVNGFSMAEIAEINLTTEAAVKQHVYRIKKKMIRMHQKDMENERRRHNY